MIRGGVRDTPPDPHSRFGVSRRVWCLIGSPRCVTNVLSPVMGQSRHGECRRRCTKTVFAKRGGGIQPGACRAAPNCPQRSPGNSIGIDRPRGSDASSHVPSIGTLRTPCIPVWRPRRRPVAETRIQGGTRCRNPGQHGKRSMNGRCRIVSRPFTKYTHSIERMTTQSLT